MLKTMRQNTKLILWILLVAFVGTILFAWGMNVTGIKKGGQAIVGVVSDRKITYQEFYRAFQSVYAQAQDRLGPEMDAETFRRLRDETWDQLVSQILLAEEIEKRKIQVSDQELVFQIRNNPPPYLLNNENLQTDGRFDPQKYAAALADPRFDWRPLENQYRALLPLQKLENIIIAAIRVTDAEVLKDFQEKNERVQVSYVAFSFSDSEVDPAEITEDEMRRYFHEHQEDFRQPRMANLDYVVLEKSPSQTDEDTIRAELEELRARALAGDDFAELAEIFSQGPSAQRGGDLGFFGRGVMDSVFESSASALQVGEISQPIRTGFGWHLIKVEEKRTQNGQQEIRARHILMKVYPGQQTLETLAEKATRLMQTARELGLETAAQEDGLQVAQTGFFQEGTMFVPGLGRASDVSEFAFAEQAGQVGGPFENERGFYIVSIRKQQAAGVPPLEEVKERVESQVMREKQRQRALQKATDFQHSLQGGKMLAEAAQETSVDVEQTISFSRRDYVPKIGLANEFVGTAFGLQEGETSDLVETERGYYFLQLVSREDADLKEFEEQKETLKLDMLRRKQNQAYADWYEGLKERAKIKDYRDRFFRG